MKESRKTDEQLSNEVEARKVGLFAEQAREEAMIEREQEGIVAEREVIKRIIFLPLLGAKYNANRTKLGVVFALPVAMMQHGQIDTIGLDDPQVTGWINLKEVPEGKSNGQIVKAAEVIHTKEELIRFESLLHRKVLTLVGLQVSGEGRYMRIHNILTAEQEQIMKGLL